MYIYITVTSSKYKSMTPFPKLIYLRDYSKLTVTLLNIRENEFFFASLVHFIPFLDYLELNKDAIRPL